MCGFIGVKKTKLLTDEKIMESFKTLKKEDLIKPVLKLMQNILLVFIG